MPSIESKNVFEVVTAVLVLERIHEVSNTKNCSKIDWHHRSIEVPSCWPIIVTVLGQ